MRTVVQKQLTRRLRVHATREIFDESSGVRAGFAIYSLADPRELRTSRYIGQAGIPRRRLLQHLNAARLWLPDETPWWIPKPQLRPLYRWIRNLYQDGGRLPTMIVHEWLPTLRHARTAEKARIYQSLVDALPILNMEQEVLGGLWPRTECGIRADER